MILLISPFLSIQPTSAQTVPAPTPDGGVFYFKGSESVILFDGTLDNTKVNYDFNQATLPTLNKAAILAAEQQDLSDPSLSRYTGYRAYRISAGTGYDSLNYVFNDSRILDGQKGDNVTYLNANGPFIIFGGVAHGTKSTWENIGMYWYATWGIGMSKVVPKETEGAKLIKLRTYDITQAVNDDHERIKAERQLWKLRDLLPGGGVGPISEAMLGSDLTSYCVQSKLKWNTLKQMVREFFIPMPDASHASVNANWSNNRDSWIERMKSGETIRNHFLNLFEYLGLPPSYLNNAGTDATFGLTSTGETNATNIATKVSELKSIIDIIKSSTDTPLEGAPEDKSWPCGNTAKIAEFKWDAALTAKPIDTLTQFSEAVDKLFEDFQDFKTAMGSPEGGEDSQCKQTGTGFIAMVNEGFCAMLVVVKGWADGFFKTAVCWLKASLGVSDAGQTTPTDSSCPTSSSGGGGGTPIVLPPNKLTFASSSIGFDATAVIADIKTAATGTSTITGDIYPMNGGTRVDSKKNVAAIKFTGEIKDPAPIEIYSQTLMDDAWCATYTSFVFIFPAGSNSYKIMFNKTGTGTFAITGKITRTTAVSAPAPTPAPGGDRDVIWGVLNWVGSENEGSAASKTCLRSKAAAEDQAKGFDLAKEQCLTQKFIFGQQDSRQTNDDGIQIINGGIASYTLAKNKCGKKVIILKTDCSYSGIGTMDGSASYFAF